MKLAGMIVKHRLLILTAVILLLVPAFFGMAATRVNYDMLAYLPSDMDTVIGQKELTDEFGKGAFSLIVIEDMPSKDVAALKDKIEKIDHVESVIWYDSVADLSVPMEILPKKLYDTFNDGNATMMAVFFKTTTSADPTMDAITAIKKTAGRSCFVSGMSALVTDLKDLCEREEPVYVAIAVILALVAMMLLLDSFLVPFIFLASIGMMILLNLGSNIFLGEISYITKALSAVLQLAVTMDYSIFLWHSYNEEAEKRDDRKDAMAAAIRNTFSSVLGSSVTTVAGFIALCFMSFTMGRDLGIVMAKGVILGVIGCVTVLPSLILVFDKPLQKTRHRALLPDMNRLSSAVVRLFPLFLATFALILPPAFYGYKKANDEVYYDITESLPDDMDFAVANRKLSEHFDISTTHMILIPATVPDKNVRIMCEKIEAVDGVKAVLGLPTLIGSDIPEEFLPRSLTKLLKGDKWQFLIVNSEYRLATDETSAQLDHIEDIMKETDEKAMLIGEAPCTKDMIETTDHDFKVVNIISVVAVFVIIAFVTGSLSLPIILIAVIEAAIFVNLGLPHYLGQRLPFIAPICISTIQLGATVDYAILMTTRFKKELAGGVPKREAVRIALASSIPSITVSGAGLFAATFGVALFSGIDLISSLCMLLARGAIISMLMVIFVLPALLYLFGGARHVPLSKAEG